MSASPHRADHQPGQLPARQVIGSYARRMNIEQRLAEAIQSLSLDALVGAVPLNVDLDIVLSVLAHTVCAALRRCLRLSHPRHAPAPVSQHRRDHPQPQIRDRGPPRPAYLFSRPPPGQRSRNHYRSLVARPHPPLRVRLTWTGGRFR